MVDFVLKVTYFVMMLNNQLPKGQAKQRFAAMGRAHRTNAEKIFANIRRVPQWWVALGFGLHSAAEAAATGLTTSAENEAMFEQIDAFQQASEICSLTAFVRF